MAKIIFYFMHF